MLHNKKKVLQQKLQSPNKVFAVERGLNVKFQVSNIGNFRDHKIPSTGLLEHAESCSWDVCLVLCYAMLLFLCIQYVCVLLLHPMLFFSDKCVELRFAVVNFPLFGASIMFAVQNSGTLKPHQSELLVKRFFRRDSEQQKKPSPN
eukprot:TRINITY_DN31657_c1_g1_i2.p1 TRINITY_DN31657_c1_g1~~TRINITY_DN31657_c1_g1_i2.p1  ORF type:complete len:145 (-),score=11.07 TRINITY_DN31657_c1_g1_i2:194-628(-)